MADVPETLDDLYVEELKDLWSANDQMLRLLERVAPLASEPKLKKMLEKSLEGIERHTDVLRELLEEMGEEDEPEHCAGMEGLVEEAEKHLLDEAPDEGPVLDALIIAQYQRMTHYGLAGFGTAAAYADALDLDEDVEKLKAATAEIYNGDEYASRLAETLVNIKAADEEDEDEDEEDDEDEVEPLDAEDRR